MELFESMSWAVFVKWFSVIWIVAFFGWLLYSFNQFSIIDSLSHLKSHWPIYIAASFSSYLFATIGWRYLDNNSELIQIGFWNLFFIRQAGESLGQINPIGVIGGDLLKTKLLKKVSGLDLQTLPSIYLLRIHSILSFVFLFTLFLIYLLIDRFGLKSDFFFILGCSFILILVLINFFKKNIFKFLRFLLVRLELWFEGKFPFESMRQNINKVEIISKNLFSKKRFVVGHLFLLIHWIAGGFEVYIILYLMGLDVSIINSYLIDYSAMLVKTIGQIIPAQVGVEELANKFLLENVLKLASATWVIFSILRRLRQILWIITSFIYLLVIKYVYAKKENSLSVS